jgi:hypothetical protein
MQLNFHRIPIRKCTNIVKTYLTFLLTMSGVAIEGYGIGVCLDQRRES